MEEVLIDYITGKPVLNQGPEGSRQLFEKFLVEDRGFKKKEIRVDEEIRVTFQGEPYVSSLDLVVFCDDLAFMAVRCIAGSLGSYEREILAGARLIFEHQIPFSVSTNGLDALVRDVITGKPVGEGLDSVPTKSEAIKLIEDFTPILFPKEKKEREMIIFRSYNMDKFNDECKD